MVKLSRCPLTSQEHDSPTAVRRGERSKEGKRDSERRAKNRGEERGHWCSLDSSVEGRAAIPRWTRPENAVQYCTREQWVGYFCRAMGHGAGEGRSAPSSPFAWPYLHRGAAPPWKRAFLLSSLCAFRVFVFLAPLFTAKLDERDGEGVRSTIATPRPPSPLCIFHPRNSINAPRWSSSLSTSFHRNSNLPGILRRWKLNFFS